MLVGIHEDENGKWQWRKDYYGDMPTKERLKTDIEELINSQTDESILKGLVWNDIPVWLATEKLLYSKNNKKYDAKADYVRWYSPLGRNFDFEVYNNYLRIQGTSSTKYPWKNLRIYLNKGPKTEEEPLRLLIGGVETSTLKYPLRGATNSVAQSVLCAKTDFVDSSMTLNTGGAKLFDNIMRTLGLKATVEASGWAVVRIDTDGTCNVDVKKADHAKVLR